MDEFDPDVEYPRDLTGTLAAFTRSVSRRALLNAEISVTCAYCKKKWQTTGGWAEKRNPNQIFCTSSCQELYRARKKEARRARRIARLQAQRELKGET